MRRRTLLHLVAIAVSVTLGLVAQAQGRSERLITGDQKTLAPGYAVGDVAMANPGVCDFRVVSGRRELMLIATGPGFTTLTIWDQKGVKRDEIAIEVVSREYAKLVADLTELVRPYADVTVRSLGNRIVLAGTVNTAGELDAIRTFATADNRILSTVTLKGAPAAAVDPPASTPRPNPPPAAPPESTPPPAARPVSPPLPTTPSIVVDPAPPPPTRAVPNAPVPVSLAPSQAPPPAPVSSTTPPAAPVVAVPTPPPPNVTPIDAARLPSRPGAATATAPAESLSIEYQIEIYEAPASAPPPEVMGPQGTRLFSGRLVTTAGAEAQQVVTVGQKTTTPATMRGIRVAVTPTVSGATVQTAVVIDTNLPVGQYSQEKTPVWLRAQLTFSAASGQKRYITEAEIARVATPTGTAPVTGEGGGTAGRLAAKAADAGASIASSASGVAYIPSLGGLFGGGGPKQPKARPTMLLIVVTPVVAVR